MQLCGIVEVRIGDEWYDVINAGSLLLSHTDLNGCLFGVDNYGRYDPLFAERGIPPDRSDAIAEQFESPGMDEKSMHATWVLWSELQSVDWDERAAGRDERISEFVREDGSETQVSKWLNRQHMDWVREALDRDPEAEVVADGKVFRRLILRRRDCLEGTDFPLVMKLMECLAERFDSTSVRLVVWFP